MIKQDASRIPFSLSLDVRRYHDVKLLQDVFDELEDCFSSKKLSESLELKLYRHIASEMEMYSSAFTWARQSRVPSFRTIAEVTLDKRSAVNIIYAMPGSGKSTLTKSFNRLGVVSETGVRVSDAICDATGVECIMAMDYDFSRSDALKEMMRNDKITLRGDKLLGDLNAQLGHLYAGRVKCYAFSHPDLVPYDINDGLPRFYVLPLSTHEIVTNIMRVAEREMDSNRALPSEFLLKYVTSAVRWVYDKIVDYHFLHHDDDSEVYHLLEQTDTLPLDFKWSLDSLTEHITAYNEELESEQIDSTLTDSNDEDLF